MVKLLCSVVRFSLLKFCIGRPEDLESYKTCALPFPCGEGLLLRCASEGLTQYLQYLKIVPADPHLYFDHFHISLHSESQIIHFFPTISISCLQLRSTCVSTIGFRIPATGTSVSRSISVQEIQFFQSFRYRACRYLFDSTTQESAAHDLYLDPFGTVLLTTEICLLTTENSLADQARFLVTLVSTTLSSCFSMPWVHCQALWTSDLPSIWCADLSRCQLLLVHASSLHINTGFGSHVLVR